MHSLEAGQPVVQSGGFKVAVAHKVKFLRHTAIGNDGPGLWFDISNDEMEVANCYAADNRHSGVMNEISYRIHVHDSVFVNNKGGGVLIAEAPGRTDRTQHHDRQRRRRDLP